MGEELHYIDLVAGTLSLVGCSFMVLSFFYHKKLRSAFGKYSMWFAICGIGNFIYPMLGSPSTGSALCTLQSMIGIYFVLVSLFTSTILVTAIYSIFLRSMPRLRMTRGSILYAWGVPLIFSFVPVITNSFTLPDEDS